MVEVEDYRLLSTLGTGISGQVYAAENMKDNKLYALKFIDRFYKDQQKEEQVILMLEQEVNAIEMVDSERVIKSTECFTTENFFVIVMEYCKNGDLFQFVKQKKFLKEEEAFEIFAQILDGIKAVHSHNLIHRDIKPENILLDDNFQIKIGDFGASIMYDKEHLLDNLCGTYYYMAPELENYEEYDFSVDMWSIGCLFFFMLTGYSPFSFCTSQLQISNTIFEFCQPSLDVDKLIKLHIEKNTIKEEDKITISKETKDLLSKMLTYKSQQRIQFLDILKHPAFKKHRKVCPSAQKLINEEKQYSQIYRQSSFLKLDRSLSIKKHDFSPTKSRNIFLNSSYSNLPSLAHINSYNNSSSENKKMISAQVTYQEIDEILSQQNIPNSYKIIGLSKHDSQYFKRGDTKTAQTKMSVKEQDTPQCKLPLKSQISDEGVASAFSINSDEQLEEGDSISNKIQRYSQSNVNFQTLKNRITSYPQTPNIQTPFFQEQYQIQFYTPSNKQTQSQSKSPLTQFSDISSGNYINKVK